jgi:hypothetical protein
MGMGLLGPGHGPGPDGLKANSRGCGPTQFKNVSLARWVSGADPNFNFDILFGLCLHGKRLARLTVNNKNALQKRSDRIGDPDIGGDYFSYLLEYVKYITNIQNDYVTITSQVNVSACVTYDILVQAFLSMDRQRYRDS